jgi:hypothetical protein
MTYTIICPKCQRESQRSNTLDRPTICQHQYHAPEDCGVCLECRTGWTPEQKQEQP